MVAPDHRVEFTDGALATWKCAQDRIAGCYMRGGAEGWSVESIDEMRFSLHQSMLSVVMMKHGGTLHVQADGAPDAMNFYWFYENSGYHGGIIFHPNYRDGKPSKTGQWSVHT
jgi:hypothetical protein